MVKGRATSGNSAQFTYDFGIAIAQSTVNKITKLTGATLTLASAFYALRSTATEYVNTLKENTLRFGGVLATMQAMEQAQDRLIKGQSYFNVDDQLRGMNELMAAGINVKKNFAFINKAAHATGKSFAEFSGMVASAIQGNSQALVDAGLMTQRATRMFDKYAANTVQRQQAILNFIKTNKALTNAIKNDFETIQDQMTRIKGIWTAFLESIIGKPNDPGSFYGQIVSSMRMVSDALAKNMQDIRARGYMIGQVLGWVAKQVGHFVIWIGKQVKKTLDSVWKVTDNYQEQTRSLLVWLEFWKLRILDFFHEYGGEIKTLFKLLLAYRALKYVFVIGGAAIKSVKAYRAALLGTIALQNRYMASMGPFIGKTAKFFQSLAVWMPRPFRRAWVWMGKFFGAFKLYMMQISAALIMAFKAPFKFIVTGFKFIIGLVRNLPAIIVALFKGLRALWAALNATNPIGWVLLAITLLTTLYVKGKGFRILVNNIFKFIWEAIKFVYNLVVGVIVYTIVGIKRVWRWLSSHIFQPIARFFGSVFKWIGEMWRKFMNSKVGRWIHDNIVEPLKSVFGWVVKAWRWVLRAIGSAVKFLSGANSSMAKNINDLAKAEGLSGLAVATSGNNYDTKDSTNYLNPKNWGSKEPKVKDEPTPKNPLLASYGDTTGANGNNTAGATNMNFSNGAVQIIVQKGENINERVLAQKVREVLYEMQREGNMRGGTL